MAVSEDQLVQGLLSLGQSLGSDVPLAVRLTDLCRTTAELVGCDRGSLFLRDGRYYHLMYNHGTPPDIAAAFANFRVRADDPLVTAALNNGGFAVINDAAGSPLLNAQTTHLAHIQSIVVALMFDPQRQPLGFITAEYNDTRGTFTQTMSTLVLGLAKLAELAIVADRREAQRRRADERLAEREVHLRTIVQSEPECVKLLAVDGMLLEMNPAGLAMIEADSLGEIVGQSVYPLVTEPHRPAFIALIEAAFRGESGGMEFEIVGLKGTHRWLESRTVPLRGPSGEIRAALGITRDITERKRAEQKGAALLDVARDITGTLDFDAILARVQRRTAEALPCDSVITSYWDPVRETFRIVSHYGVPEDLVAPVTALTIGPGGMFGGRLTRGETVVVNDLNDWPALRDAVLARFNVAAMIATPLVVGGHTLGRFFALNRRSGERFVPDQVQLFESIARQLAVAIEAAELYRAQQEEAQVSGALARAGQELLLSLDTPRILDRVCQLTVEILECDCSHAFLDETKGQGFAAVSGCGDTSEQWEAIRVLRIPRAALSPAFFDQLERHELCQVVMAEPQDLLPALSARYGITVGMYVALRRGQEIIGVLAAGYRGRRERFTRRQERSARGIAQLASVALANAQLMEELGRANRVKSEFVATISHELRTPLNVIIGYNELLFDGAFGALNPEQIYTLQRADKASRELLDLVNATLDMSRLEAGRVPVNLADVHLAELLAEVEAETRLVRLKPGLDFTCQVPPNLPPLHTDRTKLKVIVKNLIANAIKFTETGGVSVVAAARDGGVEVAVSDTGIGIAPEMLPIIFEPFRQADGSLTRSHGGVGLGLYIVRRLLDMLGGAIRVDSEVGRGSTFRAWLPATLDQPSAVR